jgi:hypothetical protein
MSTMTPETPEQREFNDEDQYWGNVRKIVRNLRALNLHNGDPAAYAVDIETVDDESFLNDQFSATLHLYHLPTGPLYGNFWRIDRTHGIEETKAMAFVPKVRRGKRGEVLVPESGGWHHLRQATFEETCTVLGIAREINKARGNRPK